MSLFETLKERKELISYGKELVRDTKSLYDEFGKDILTSSYDKFDALEKSLNSDQVRMVVIGEFSRGKSSLLNALLEITQLPTASEATTAINTFVYGLSEKEKTPHLEIVFRDGHKERVEIKGSQSEELQKWGTELDTENSDPRKDVEYINLYIDHPLLNLGLVLIDTPGLESMQEHHEEITRHAISSAHIAIWVQSATQLGGNAREWAFLSNTIRKSFRKFLTVINMWDLVLDPQDEQDKLIPLALREKNKMNVVKGQFRKALSMASEEELANMTSDKSLFGVSARWALRGTEEQKQQSGLKKLSRRIQEICSSDEARAEIFYKPMKELSELQNKLKAYLEDNLNALDNQKSLEQQKMDCERLEMDIKQLELEMQNTINEAKNDHDRLSKECINQVQEEIAEPLRELKQQIEIQVTPEYVAECIRAKEHTINLPQNLLNEYQDTLQEIDSKWAKQRTFISEILQELRADYAKEMNKHLGQLSVALESLDISLPEVNIECDLNFDTLENFYAQKLEIEKKIADCEEEIFDYDAKILEHTNNKELLQNAQEALKRAEYRLTQLGPAPQPLTRQERRKVSSGGLYSSPTYETVEVADFTPVEEWKEMYSQMNELVRDKEKALEAIIRDEAAKTGKRISLETAKRKLEQRLQKMRRQLEEAEKQSNEESAALVARTHRQLLLATSGQLDKFIRSLERNAIEGVAQIFDHQLEFLRTCVSEQFMEPLRSKQASREEAIQLFEKGKTEIEERRAKLVCALEKLTEISGRTAACLSNASLSE